jgi:light-independent protochlorophyllide reductase subunit B
MKLAYWMYAGPAHIGTLRVASSFKNVHGLMHAPLGDDYFNVMRSMLERERDFTPVTASIVDRHVLARGSQEKVVENIRRKDKEDEPNLILLTPTCTSSILQEDLANFASRASMESNCDVLLSDINHYRVNELQAADRTLEQIVRFYVEKAQRDGELDKEQKTTQPSVNLIGVFTLGFHNQHDCRELKRLLQDLNISLNLVIPEGSEVTDLKKLKRGWVNIVPYREVGLMAAEYLENKLHIPYITTTPMGTLEIGNFILELKKILSSEHKKLGNQASHAKVGSDLFFNSYIREQSSFVAQAAWFARSVDCQNLSGKKAVVFGDTTHAAAITKILSKELGIRVCCAGTFCKQDGDWFREQVVGLCDEILITEDHTEVGDMIARLEPSAIFGTQMERHIGKRLDIPCGVISAPVHIQNFPLGYRPFLGYEGTNQICDLIYNTFTLGMEDHLLEIFGGHDNKEVITKSLSTDSSFAWSKDGLIELNKIPGFVRGKVKRNTEKFAREQQIKQITTEVMFRAKEAIVK